MANYLVRSSVHIHTCKIMMKTSAEEPTATFSKLDPNPNTESVLFGDWSSSVRSWLKLEQLLWLRPLD